MTRPPEAPEPIWTLGVPLDVHGRLAVDLPCAECGHNLRGLLPTGVCVECGTPAALARAAGPLAAAGAGWLARVRSGTGLAFVALPWVWLPLSWPILLVGAWRMAAPDTGARAEREFLAGTTRAAVLGAVVVLGLLVGLALVDATVIPRDPRFDVLLVLAIAAALTALVGLPALRLARRVRLLDWDVLAGLACLALGAGVWAVPFRVATAMLDLGLYIVGGAGVCAAGVALVAVSLARIWRRLDRAEAFAVSRGPAGSSASAPPGASDDSPVPPPAGT